MNPILFKAILSMDAYNRGYDAGIKFGNLSGNNSDDSFGIQIGNAQIITNSAIFTQGGNRIDDDIGFYGIAYQAKDANGNVTETIISYRGTDQPPTLIKPLVLLIWLCCFPSLALGPQILREPPHINRFGPRVNPDRI